MSNQNCFYQKILLEMGNEEFQKRLVILLAKLQGDMGDRAFGRELETSHNTIRTWINGDSVPSIGMLRKLARYSNQSLAELIAYLSGEGEDKSATPIVPKLKTARETLPYLQGLSEREKYKLALKLLNTIDTDYLFKDKR